MINVKEHIVIESIGKVSLKIYNVKNNRYFINFENITM